VIFFIFLLFNFFYAALFTELASHYVSTTQITLPEAFIETYTHTYAYTYINTPYTHRYIRTRTHIRKCHQVVRCTLTLLKVSLCFVIKLVITDKLETLHIYTKVNTGNSCVFFSLNVIRRMSCVAISASKAIQQLSSSRMVVLMKSTKVNATLTAWETSLRCKQKIEKEVRLQNPRIGRDVRLQEHNRKWRM